jgi:hypothetical protein
VSPKGYRPRMVSYSLRSPLLRRPSHSNQKLVDSATVSRRVRPNGKPHVPAPRMRTVGLVNMSFGLWVDGQQSEIPQKFQLDWRTGWDSNPRESCPSAGFQDRCLKPLGHPSKLCIAWFLMVAQQLTPPAFANQLSARWQTCAPFVLKSDARWRVKMKARADHDPRLDPWPP